MLLRIDTERPAPRQLAAAVDALRKGDVIIYPTDTGYAFGCALSSARGITKLRKLKGFGEKHPKPLTMLVRDIAEIGKFAHMSNQAFRTIRRLLPGPYTIVLPATSDVPRAMKNRNHEVGLRMPDNPVCTMLVDLLGEPLLTGSVTPFEDTPELDDPEELERIHARDVRVVIDGGPLWPDPSTVLRLVDDEIEVLREGKGPVPE
jgi:tRNA threonylcarbamoyl adenosine modification protein (Sua5/YciO/YrdC/YwlC family)